MTIDIVAQFARSVHWLHVAFGPFGLFGSSGPFGSFGPWAYRRLTNFVKNQVDEATKRLVGVHYQQLTQHEPRSLECDSLGDGTPYHLDFKEFEHIAKCKKSLLSWLWKCLRRGQLGASVWEQT